MFLEIAEKHQELLRQTRRELHRIPELGFEEEKTSKYIMNFLDRYGIEYEKVPPTGVLACIRGEKPGKVRAVRADIDGLPLDEEGDVPFKSVHPGRMHACGHDAHTAIALVLAKILKEQKNQLPGEVKFIFQPNEEGWPSGAPKMIENNVLKNPDVDTIIGLHISTDIDDGIVGIKPDIISSFVYNFDVTIKGTGGHAAAPHLADDPVVVASQIIVSLQTIASRFNNPVHPFVLTIGKIEGGSARNIITSEVNFSGTIRMTNPEKTRDVKERFHELIHGQAKAFHLEADIKFWESCPAIINDTELCTKFLEKAKKNFKDEDVMKIRYPSLGADDFAFYTKYCKGIFFRFGVRDPEIGAVYAGHTPKFKMSDKYLYRALTMYMEMLFDADI